MRNAGKNPSPRPAALPLDLQYRKFLLPFTAWASLPLSSLAPTYLPSSASWNGADFDALVLSCDSHALALVATRTVSSQYFVVKNAPAHQQRAAPRPYDTQSLQWHVCTRHSHCNISIWPSDSNTSLQEVESQNNDINATASLQPGNHPTALTNPCSPTVSKHHENCSLRVVETTIHTYIQWRDRTTKTQFNQ